MQEVEDDSDKQEEEEDSDKQEEDSDDRAIRPTRKRARVVQEPSDSETEELPDDDIRKKLENMSSMSMRSSGSWPKLPRTSLGLASARLVSCT